MYIWWIIFYNLFSHCLLLNAKFIFPFPSHQNSTWIEWTIGRRCASQGEKRLRINCVSTCISSDGKRVDSRCVSILTQLNLFVDNARQLTRPIKWPVYRFEEMTSCCDPSGDIFIIRPDTLTSYFIAGPIKFKWKHKQQDSWQHEETECAVHNSRSVSSSIISSLTFS